MLVSSTICRCILREKPRGKAIACLLEQSCSFVVTIDWNQEYEETAFTTFKSFDRRTQTTWISCHCFFFSTRRQTWTVVQLFSGIHVLVLIPWFWYSFKPGEKANLFPAASHVLDVVNLGKEKTKDHSSKFGRLCCVRLKGWWWERREKRSYEKLLYVFA